ncbi:SDR family oxidoreductase [Iodidimonas sp. SYSU 1G8]|uniref:SDR family NAD(P)-dependent oxidoreductase n=1 Tax=Iodidimonas sp. SYSU 1G8 TaxID=3133967 RepID=UPI0031FF1D40
MGALDLFKLDGKVAVITGAGKGIGRGIALALAEAGADIAVASRSKDELDRVVKEVQERGRRAIAVPTDVTKMEFLENLAKRAQDELGGLDIWVNNAGGLPDGTPRWLTRTSEEQFMAQIDLNIKAVWAGCVVAAKAMGENGGAIVNISSRAAKDMGPNLKNGPYGASKSAVNSLTATFSRELAPKIRVNAVAPGPIPTENFIDSMKMHTPEREAELKEYMKLPLERWGTPEDIGAAVLYMSSPASGWVTGQCLYVTGGS